MFYLNEAEVGLGGGRRGKDLFIMLVSTAGTANEPLDPVRHVRTGGHPQRQAKWEDTHRGQ